MAAETPATPAIDQLASRHPGPAYDVPLREQDACADPLDQFRRWFAEASEVVRIPEAVAVATSDGAGTPSLRMVLVKRVDELGFSFFTSYTSQKGRELLARPAAELLFHWDPLGRQVRISGAVEQVSGAESDEYFTARPRGSQLSAIASSQSSPIAERGELERIVAELSARYEGSPLPRPPVWGGFRLRPARYEFWQNRSDRLHDRLLYQAGEGGWSMRRLQP